jgi:hypothetical protein
MTNPAISANTHVAGCYLLLEKLIQQTGLGITIKQCFPELHKEILSLVHFIVQKGLPLYHGSWLLQ